MLQKFKETTKVGNCCVLGCDAMIYDQNEKLCLKHYRLEVGEAEATQEQMEEWEGREDVRNEDNG